MWKHVHGQETTKQFVVTIGIIAPHIYCVGAHIIFQSHIYFKFERKKKRKYLESCALIKLYRVHWKKYIHHNAFSINS